MTDITMPQLTDQMEEGTIVKWLVADGAAVVSGDELCEIETDKATVTHEADSGGVVTIVAPEGSTVLVGQVIARIGATVDVARDGAAPSPSAEPPSAEPPPADALLSADAPSTAAVPPPDAGVPVGVATGVPATPLARRVAHVHGVALGDVVGSGPRGRITKRDVLRAAGIELAEEPVAEPVVALSSPAAPTAGSTAPPAGVDVDVEVVEPTRLQQVIARRMSEQALVPVFEVETEVEMDAALAFRASLKAVAGETPPPSVNDLILKACALALRDHPRVNASYQDERFLLHRRVHLGMAVASDAGLLVGTIRDADQKSLGRLAVESRAIAERIRAGSAAPDELTGATFTVSNLGMYGMSRITAVVNPPQAAILGVGAARPVLTRTADGEIVERHVAALNLTCDHRILNGADGAVFVSDVKALLEFPMRLAL